ncbi:MAG: CDP-alcohol phosphatidyltransferase family protein [Actinomycetota bacterium]|nr:CDP-alcohol phosphatidyltransferase family protein [Actinomycetota bacterium]
MANFITCLRFAITPAFVAFIVLSNAHPSFRYVAFGLFVFGALTDWADGFIARRTNTVSEFGKTADPLADRILIDVALVTLYAMRMLPFLYLLLILSRDFITLFVYSVVDWEKLKKIKVHWTGKVGTAILFLGLSCLILSPAPHRGSRFSFAGFSFTDFSSWQTYGMWIIAIGLVWALTAGYIYISRVISLATKKPNESKQET